MHFVLCAYIILPVIIRVNMLEFYVPAAIHVLNERPEGETFVDQRKSFHLAHEYVISQQACVLCVFHIPSSRERIGSFFFCRHIRGQID
jgi:hypothetical protein